MPALSLRHRQHLAEREAADDRLPPLERGDHRGRALDAPLDRVLGQPRPRRVPARAVEGRAVALTLPRQPGLDVAVGRLEQDREVGASCTSRERSKSVGQGVPLLRQLLLAEQEQCHVDRARLGRARSRTSSSATARPPFMSVAPRPCTAPPSIRPGRLSCAGTVS